MRLLSCLIRQSMVNLDDNNGASTHGQVAATHKLVRGYRQEEGLLRADWCWQSSDSTSDCLSLPLKLAPAVKAKGYRYSFRCLDLFPVKQHANNCLFLKNSSLNAYTGGSMYNRQRLIETIIYTKSVRIKAPINYRSRKNRPGGLEKAKSAIVALACHSQVRHLPFEWGHLFACQTLRQMYQSVA